MNQTRGTQKITFDFDIVGEDQLDTWMMMMAGNEHSRQWDATTAPQGNQVTMVVDRKTQKKNC